MKVSAWLEVVPEMRADGAVRSLSIRKATQRFPSSVGALSRVVKVTLDIDHEAFAALIAPTLEIQSKNLLTIAQEEPE